MASQSTQMKRPDTEHEHSIATYEIIRDPEGWTVLHEGQKLGTFDQRVAAYDSTVAAAKSSIRSGHGVTIKLPHAIGIPV